MSRIKYHYNSKTLEYERYVESWRRKLGRVLFMLAAAVVFSTLVIFLAYRYLDSPKERQLKREIANLELNYSILSKRLNNLEIVLNDLQQRDNLVYRVIFEADPIPDETRKAGYGGVNRYKQFEGFEYSTVIKEVTKQTDRISKQMVVQSQSFDEIWNMAKQRDKMLASIPSIMPVKVTDLKQMASGYGYRMDPVYKTTKFHTGMDFSADQGKQVFVTGDGTVEYADADYSGYGIHIIVDHGFGYKTIYAHLSEKYVKAGQKLKRGELIGLVGNTGKSTGPHLHYEVRKNGEPLNPINFYFNDITPEEYQQILQISSQPGQSFD